MKRFRGVQDAFRWCKSNAIAECSVMIGWQFGWTYRYCIGLEMMIFDE